MARMRPMKMRTVPNFPLPEAADSVVQGCATSLNPRLGDEMMGWRSESTLSWISNGSTASAMSWIEDDLEREATQQLRDMWNAVEDYLYDRRPIKKFPALEAELDDWALRFPHLRLSGSKIALMRRPSNYTPDPEDTPSNEEVYASHGSASGTSTMSTSSIPEPRSFQRNSAVTRVIESLSENVWDAITDDLKKVLEAYSEKLIESSAKRPSSSFVVPRIGTLYEEIAVVATDISDEEDGDKTPTPGVNSLPPPIFPTYPPRGKRKSLPNVLNSKSTEEELGGSVARLEAVKKIDKKVQRLARQKSKSSPADVIELRSINSTSGPYARQVKFKLPSTSKPQSQNPSNLPSRTSSGSSSKSRVSRRGPDGEWNQSALHLPPVPVSREKSPVKEVPMDVFARSRSASGLAGRVATVFNPVLREVKSNPNLERKYRPLTASVAIAPAAAPLRYPNLSRTKKGSSRRLKLDPLPNSTSKKEPLTSNRMTLSTRP